MMSASQPQSSPWISGDGFLSLMRAAYAALCDKLDSVDQDDDWEPLILSNACDELATVISFYDGQREVLR